MNKCVIAIPIYKEKPSFSEVLSFKQIILILGNYDICIFTHKDCDLTVYEQIASELGKKYVVELFHGEYFKSVEGYNKLCFSLMFYERFNKHEYILIYQLDAWVFRDELQNWCEKGYDYIGAPIFWAHNNNSFTKKIAGIGNGGFSLRKISYCIKMLNMPRNRPYMTPYRILQLYYNYFLFDDKFKPIARKLLIIPLCLLKMFGIYNNINYFMKTKQINEDMMFGTNAKYAWGGRVSLPSEIEAMKFSFEVHPEMLFHKIDNRLPFGCHAFEKWDYDSFWSKYIKF